MFVEIQRDATLGRVFRGVRLVSGRRRAWITGTTLFAISIGIYKRGGGTVALLYIHRSCLKLPAMPRLWLYLFKRWNHEHAKLRWVQTDT
jgi:hypothetical protein